jgi:predicted glycoside hydrolase/deacetylase ChbG (UPF0249 family)
MSRQLIVNADDFARDPEVNQGILVAHNKGIVTTTTVLINMPSAVQAVQEAGQTAPNLGIGLHLNLTLGTPCSPVNDIPGLVDKDSRFHKVEYWHAYPLSAPIQEIEIEWRAQVDRFLSTGVDIDHLDSHHHIAVIRPDIWELFLQIAAELNCGVRPPYPADLDEDEIELLFPKHMLENARIHAIPSLKQSLIAHPDAFLGSFFNKHANLDHLLNLVRNLPGDSNELMCHPGYASASLKATSSYAEQRVIELDALTHPRTKQLIDELTIDLVTYQQAWPSE